MAVLHDDGDPVAVRGRRFGGLLPHGLGEEVDESVGPQRGDRASGHAGVSVVRGAEHPVEAGAQCGFDQVGVAWGEQAVDPQPTLERPRGVQRAHLVARLIALLVACSVGNSGKPMAGHEPEALGGQRLGLLQPEGVVFHGERAVVLTAPRRPRPHVGGVTRRLLVEAAGTPTTQPLPVIREEIATSGLLGG